MNDETSAVPEGSIPRPESARADDFGLSPAGWYPADDKPGYERFWNGTSWSKRTRDADPELELIRQDEKMISFGWLFGVLLPWSGIGFVLGAVLVFRGRRVESGVGMMLLTVVMSIFWFVVLARIGGGDTHFSMWANSPS
jgi:hypothetical protein